MSQDNLTLTTQSPSISTFFAVVREKKSETRCPSILFTTYQGPGMRWGYFPTNFGLDVLAKLLV